MKAYLDVDKTCAMKGDTISYAISYRNYGALDAQNVVVTDTIPNDLSFLSCTGGGTYQSSSHTVSWTIGTVPGFKTATGIIPTSKKAPNNCLIIATSQINGTIRENNEACLLDTHHRQPPHPIQFHRFYTARP